MSFKQSFILAIKSLAGSKMRAFLTMLGIIIGVAAVIILISVVDGFKGMMLNEFEKLGTNTLNVYINPRSSTKHVYVEDMMEFAAKHTDVIAGVTPNVSGSGYTIKIGTETLSSTTLSGVNEMAADINKIEMDAGRFLEYMDVEKRQRNCVVGSYIAKEYFGGSEQAIGQTVKVSGNPVVIVGVVKESAGGTESSADDRIYLPYSTMRAVVQQVAGGNYTVAAINKDYSMQAKAVIEAYLYSVFENDDYYRVVSMAEIMDMADEMTGTLTAILVGIAAISLLVGGIGIMNIMLVSVTERTREIGIRKSLGAKKWDIMSQFVVEAATTSAVGGVVGILLGAVVSIAAGMLLKIDATPSAMAILVSFSVSAAIGIMFGYFPANKAAKLNPIDALRYD